MFVERLWDMRHPKAINWMDIRGVPEKYPTCVYIIFFDCEGAVHYEFAPRGQTINEEYYVGALKRLRDAVRRKRPRFWSSGDWLLHHDNAPVHSSKLVQQFLANHKIVQLRQPPYSPNIAPCDVWMFPKLKMAPKESGSTTSRRFRVMRRASWRPFQNLRSRTASKDATVRMTKNSTNAAIWTQVGYFSDTPRRWFKDVLWMSQGRHMSPWPLGSFSFFRQPIRGRIKRQQYISRSFEIFSPLIF